MHAQAMIVQSMKGNCCIIVAIHKYVNMWLKYNRGSKISTPGNNNAQSLEGLAAKHTKWQFYRNAGVAG